MTHCSYFSDWRSCLVSFVGRNPTQQANTMATCQSKQSKQKGKQTNKQKECLGNICQLSLSRNYKANAMFLAKASTEASKLEGIYALRCQCELDRWSCMRAAQYVDGPV